MTGSAGFIGSHLCNKSASNGHEIVAVDNLSSYYDINLKKARIKEFLSASNIDSVNIDVSKSTEVDNLVRESKPDVVIHLAAQAGVRLPVQETDKYVTSNLVGFGNILRSTVVNKVPYFLYASSSSV